MSDLPFRKSPADPGRLDVAEQISELEDRFVELMDEPTDAIAASSFPPSGTEAPRREAVPFRTRSAHDALRDRYEHVDELGFDPAYEARVAPVVEFLYRRYFRVSCRGIENVPAEGRCLLVGNHSGTLPIDGLMVRAAVKREHPSGRSVRWLTEDFLHHFPFLGVVGSRLGAVRACQENATRLLADGSALCVFPEGVKGIGKLYGERYRLQRFGRGGFVKLALRTQTPIVPFAIVGGEETNPLLARIEQLGKAVGLPYIPVTPTFPLLGPVGLLPAPTKWSIAFGAPIVLEGHEPEEAEDELLVDRLTELSRATIQGLVDGLLAERKSVFFG